ncbi:MAG: copper amine oxidase N-terminal domain-containing protein [Eubacterium sp.]|nr:copper amine oxidase N-terminal domain-containing protein [Eubacterium sp.]
MKKTNKTTAARLRGFTALCFILSLLFVPAFTSSALADVNEILIHTIDSTDAIERFKEHWKGGYNMAANHGFGTASYIGRPFSVEYISRDLEGNIVREYIFHFPIVTNGKIVSYIQQNVLELTGETGWNVGPFFSSGDITVADLNDGRAYYIVTDQRESFCDGEYAVTDDESFLMYGLDDASPTLDAVPYEGCETQIVNILEPLDMDTSQITDETVAEGEFFQNARAEGKAIQKFSLEDINGININDRVFIPLRYFCGLIDCTVGWDGETRTAYAEKDGLKAEFTIGENYYISNGEKIESDAAAVIYNDLTYIPLRYASEALGTELFYNSETKMITIAY